MKILDVWSDQAVKNSIIVFPPNTSKRDMQQIKPTSAYQYWEISTRTKKNSQTRELRVKEIQIMRHPFPNLNVEGTFKKNMANRFLINSAQDAYANVAYSLHVSLLS